MFGSFRDWHMECPHFGSGWVGLHSAQQRGEALRHSLTPVYCQQPTDSGIAKSATQQSRAVPGLCAGAAPSCNCLYGCSLKQLVAEPRHVRTSRPLMVSAATTVSSD